MTWEVQVSQNFCSKFLGPQFPVSGRKHALYPPLVQQGHLSRGEFMSCFKGDRGGLEYPSPAVSQVLVIQRNQYAKVASSGTTYPESLQGVASREQVGELVLDTNCRKSQ